MGKRNQAASRLSLEDWKVQRTKESAEAQEPKQEQAAERPMDSAEAGEAMLDITEERSREIRRLAQEHLGIVSPEEQPKVAQPIEEATEQAEEKLGEVEAEANEGIRSKLTVEQQVAKLEAEIETLEKRRQKLGQKSKEKGSVRLRHMDNSIAEARQELQKLQSGGQEQAPEKPAKNQAAAESVEKEIAVKGNTRKSAEETLQRLDRRLDENKTKLKQWNLDRIKHPGLGQAKTTEGIEFENRFKEETARLGSEIKDLAWSIGSLKYLLDEIDRRSPSKSEASEKPASKSPEAAAEPARPDTMPPESGVRERSQADEGVEGQEPEEEPAGSALRQGLGEEGDFLESEEFGLQFDIGALEGDQRLLTSNLEKLKEHVDDPVIGQEIKDLLAKSEKAARDYEQIKASGQLAGQIEDLAAVNEGLLAWSNELLPRRAGKKLEEIPSGLGKAGKAEHVPGQGPEIEVGEGELTPEEIAEFYPSEAKTAKGESKPEKAVKPKETEAAAETGEMDAEEILAILGGTHIVADYDLVTKHLNDPQIGKVGQEAMRKLQESAVQILKLESDIEAIKNLAIAESPGVSGARDRRIGALNIKLDKLKAELPGLYLQFEGLADRARELEATPSAKAEQKAAEAKIETKTASQAETGSAIQPAAQEAAAPAVKAASAMSEWMMGMQEQMEEKQKGAPLETLEAQDRETKRILLALERISAKYKSEEISLKDRSRKNAMSQGYHYPEVAEAPQAEEYKRPFFHGNIEPSGLELDIDVEKIQGGKQRGLLESRLKEVAHLGAEEWGDVYAAMDPTFTKAQWEFLDVHEKKNYQNLRKNQLENELKVMELQEELRKQSEASRQEKDRLAEAKKPNPAVMAEAAPAALPKTETMPVMPTGTVEMSAVDTAAAMAASAETNKAEQAPNPATTLDTVTGQQVEANFFAKQKAMEEMTELDKKITKVKEAIEHVQDKEAAGLVKKNSKEMRDLESQLEALESQKDGVLGVKFDERNLKEPEAPPGLIKRGAKRVVALGAVGLGGTMAWIAGKAPGAVKFLFWDSAINLLEAMVKWSDPGPALTQTINDLKKWGKEKPKKE